MFREKLKKKPRNKQLMLKSADLSLFKPWCPRVEWGFNMGYKSFT